MPSPYKGFLSPENEESMFWSIHPWADKTNNEHLPKPFSRSYKIRSIKIVGFAGKLYLLSPPTPSHSSFLLSFQLSRRTHAKALATQTKSSGWRMRQNVIKLPVVIRIKLPAVISITEAFVFSIFITIFQSFCLTLCILLLKAVSSVHLA